MAEISTVGIVLETRRPGNERGHDNGHQNIGDLRRNSFQPVHDGKSQHAHEQRGPVSVMNGSFDDTNDRFIVMVATVHVDAEHLGKLGGGDDDGRRIGESVHHRVGQKINHKTQPEHSQSELERTDHEGQQNGIGDVPSLPAVASGSRDADVMSETTATGPVAS